MDQKIRKISKESFKTKQKKLLKKFKSNLSEIKEEYKLGLSKAETDQEKRIVKKKYTRDKRIVKNRYALTYNALNDQELYRKGAMETKIALLRTKFNRKRNNDPKFNLSEEKAILSEKIKKIKKNYSRPVSSTLRKARINKTDDNLKFIRVPNKTPFQKNLNTILLLLLSAFLSTIALDIFIKPFGFYNAGLRGITQSLYYVILNFNPDTKTWVSYALFIALNIPLAIFGYYKVGKKFTIYTITFLVFQYLISLGLTSLDVEKYIKPFGKDSVEITKIIQAGNYADIGYALPLLSAFIGGIIYGIAIGYIYKAGASGGGSKFIVTYISVKKDKSVGQIAIYLSIFVVSFGLIINHIILNNKNAISAFTSITLFASVIFIFTSNTMIDQIFAKSKKEMISVVTSKKNTILRFLDVKMMYNRSFTSTNVKTSFDKNPKHKLEFLVSAQEARILMKIFIQIDPRATISSSHIERVYGKFYTSWME